MRYVVYATLLALGIYYYNQQVTRKVEAEYSNTGTSIIQATINQIVSMYNSVLKEHEAVMANEERKYQEAVRRDEEWYKQYRQKRFDRPEVQQCVAVGGAPIFGNDSQLMTDCKRGY